MSRHHHRYSAVDKAILRAVKDAAGWKCQDCGSHYKVHAHHKTPLHRGGRTVPANLEVLCFDCHKVRHRKRPKDEWAQLLDEQQYGPVSS